MNLIEFLQKEEITENATLSKFNPSCLDSNGRSEFATEIPLMNSAFKEYDELWLLRSNLLN